MAMIRSRRAGIGYKALKKLSLEKGVTMYMLLLTAFKVLLHRYTGKEFIGLMTPFANRIRPETRWLIGWIEHTLILNTHIGDNPCFSDLLRRVREGCLTAYQHQEIPGSMIFTELLPRYGTYEVLLRLPRIPIYLFEREAAEKAHFDNPGLRFIFATAFNYAHFHINIQSCQSFLLPE